MNGKIVTGTRVLLGLLFVIFGANGLMMVLTGSGFIPAPEPKPEVMEIMSGFFKVGYLMPLVKSLQIISGLFLLSNRFVNLALIFLGPILVNILCVHIFIDLSGLPVAIVFCVLYGIILKSRWPDFKFILKAL